MQCVIMPKQRHVRTVCKNNIFIIALQRANSEPCAYCGIPARINEVAIYRSGNNRTYYIPRHECVKRSPTLTIHKVHHWSHICMQFDLIGYFTLMITPIVCEKIGLRGTNSTEAIGICCICGSDTIAHPMCVECIIYSALDRMTACICRMPVLDENDTAVGVMMDGTIVKGHQTCIRIQCAVGCRIQTQLTLLNKK